MSEACINNSTYSVLSPVPTLSGISCIMSCIINTVGRRGGI